MGYWTTLTAFIRVSDQLATYVGEHGHHYPSSTTDMDKYTAAARLAAEIEFDAAVDRDGANHPPHPDEVISMCVWPDGTECEYSELEEYLAFMSDDYAVVMV